VQRLTGIGVSPGIAIGQAVLLMQNPLVVRFSISAERVEKEVARLEEAHQRSKHQLEEIKARVARTAGRELGGIFDAQLLMLEDRMLITRALELVRGQHVNAEWAVQQAFDELATIFDEIEDPYLRERKGDVGDVVGRLRLNLGRGRPQGHDLLRDVEDASVLVADELTASMAAQLDWHRIRGFASDTGSRTYHTAIVARSLHVPAVVGLGDASRRVRPGATVVIDGEAGELLIDPPAAMLLEIRARGHAQAGVAHARDEYRTVAGRTADGVPITLQANIELPEDLDFAHECGAEGVGLYRSEFLLATRAADSLSEEVQYAAYRAIVERMAPAPVTIRTFDVDEDQVARWPRGGEAGAAGVGRSRGPLGLRAIRLCLARPELFRTQLRALLRAGRHGQLRIMFPFVSGVEELRQARAVVRDAAAELAARGERPAKVPVGMMIEIPSAATTADLFAREVDFFSIGTNDLIQFSLAVDRTDARVSRLYEPLHPAIVRMIRHVARSAARYRVPLSLCGEMAADPVLLPLLVGLGLREFSMSPSAIPIAKQVLQRIRASEMTRIAARVMRLATAGEIERALLRALGGADRNAGS
jgi:phosphotransferase system enzyme I (PtsI)